MSNPESLLNINHEPLELEESSQVIGYLLSNLMRLSDFSNNTEEMTEHKILIKRLQRYLRFTNTSLTKSKNSNWKLTRKNLLNKGGVVCVIDPIENGIRVQESKPKSKIIKTYIFQYTDSDPIIQIPKQDNEIPFYDPEIWFRNELNNLAETIVLALYGPPQVPKPGKYNRNR